MAATLSTSRWKDIAMAEKNCQEHALVSQSPRRKRARKAIAMRELAAMFASMLLPEAERTALREAKAPAKRVVALFEPHHIVFHAIGGSDRWHNLEPLRKAEHAERTPADISAVAKVRRMERKHKDFVNRILAADKKPREQPSRWPKGRKLQGRNDLGSRRSRWT
jgi:hypothetical protein